MRFIDLTKLRPASDWRAAAARAAEEVAAATPEERHAIIERHSKIWSSLKEKLRELSYKKCWYCESRDDRSDNAVDHWRPKGAVAGTDHPGYWWLAFTLSNYRYSCTFCNSFRRAKDTAGGKQDHFPLCDEDQRAKSPTDELTLEEPALLDPTVGLDPPSLWFEADGQAVPKYTKGAAPKSVYRAEVSTTLYHLNHVDLVERRALVFQRVAELVSTGNRLHKSYLNGDEAAAAGLAQVYQDLTRYIGSEAEHSAAARCALAAFRGEAWVEEIWMCA